MPFIDVRPGNFLQQPIDLDENRAVTGSMSIPLAIWCNHNLFFKKKKSYNNGSKSNLDVAVLRTRFSLRIVAVILLDRIFPIHT